MILLCNGLSFHINWARNGNAGVVSFEGMGADIGTEGDVVEFWEMVFESDGLVEGLLHFTGFFPCCLKT